MLGLDQITAALVIVLFAAYFGAGLMEKLFGRRRKGGRR